MLGGGGDQNGDRVYLSGSKHTDHFHPVCTRTLCSVAVYLSFSHSWPMVPLPHLVVELSPYATRPERQKCLTRCFSINPSPPSLSPFLHTFSLRLSLLNRRRCRLLAAAALTVYSGRPRLSLPLPRYFLRRPPLFPFKDLVGQTTTKIAFIMERIGDNFPPLFLHTIFALGRTHLFERSLASGIRRIKSRGS